MFKTLIALVVSMTATTALLGWIDPSIETVSSAPTAEEVLPVARDLVTTGLGSHRAAWAGIELVATQASPESPIWLAAGSDPRDHHFSVDSVGRLTGTRVWRDQGTVEGKSGAVIVFMPLSSPELGPTEAQISATRALVRALDEFAASPETPLFIRSTVR